MASNGTTVNGDAGVEIDEDLHSRQLAVYGKESMRKLAAADVLIVGMNGLGVEVGMLYFMSMMAGAGVLRVGRPPLMMALDADAQTTTAKNVILAGVRSVTIADKAEVTVRDMAAHFYLGKGDVGKNRAEASKDALQELNTGVAVTAYTGDITNDFVSQFKVGGVVLITVLIIALSSSSPSIIIITTTGGGGFGRAPCRGSAHR